MSRPLATVRSVYGHVLFWPLVVAALGVWLSFSFLRDAIGTLIMLRNAGLVFFMLGFVISVHELSHLVLARAFGVTIKEFGFGFGPTLLSVRKASIDWKLRALPIGGYVSAVGEENDEGPGSLANLAAWKKAVIWYGGPLANFALAFVLLFGVMFFASSHDPTLAMWKTMRVIELVVTTTVSMTIAGFATLPQDPLSIPFVGLPGMVSGASYIIDNGVAMIVIMAAVVSASIGFVNILPIPPLDGGQAVLGLAKGIMGRHYPARLGRALTVGGFVFLLGFMALITGIDLIREIIGYKLLGI